MFQMLTSGIIIGDTLKDINKNQKNENISHFLRIACKVSFFRCLYLLISALDLIAKVVKVTYLLCNHVRYFQRNGHYVVYGRLRSDASIRHERD